MYNTLEEIKSAAKNGKRGIISVAAAHDHEVLKAIAEARREGIADAVLTGHEDRIKAILAEMGETAADYEIINCEDDAEAAKAAVMAVKEGKAGFLMKGIMPTGTILKAVLDKEADLRTGRLLSHCMLYEIPGYGKLLNNTDGGMNTYPDLEKKADILENAAILMKNLGYDEIFASCVCGAEQVSPKIQATVDADTISRMTDRWDKYNMKVIGPVGLDLAISPAACAHKGYSAPGAGKADIILVPTYEVGNGIGKALTYFAGAKSAGVIVGARVPVVLVSRADDAETKLASIALGAVAVR